MAEAPPLEIECACHGRCVAAVLCAHLLAKGPPVGFIENSSDPDDLQAWCSACEAKFVAEGGMTDAFREFTRMSVVCTNCYEEAALRHSHE